MLKWMEFCAFKNWNIVDLQYHVSFKCTAQRFSYIHICTNRYGLPRWPSSKESACNPGVAGDTGSIPGLRTSPGGGHGNLLQYSCLENPMDRGAWRATVHGLAKSWTRLEQLSTHANPLNSQHCPPSAATCLWMAPKNLRTVGRIQELLTSKKSRILFFS